MKRLHGKWRLIVLLLAAGMAVRVGYILTLPDRPIAPDESDYINSAMGLVDDCSFEKTVFFHVPPVTPLAYATVFLITGPGYRTARLFQSLLFFVTGLVFYLLGRELAGRTGGVMTLAIGAFFPYFVYFDGMALSESLSILMIPAMVLCGLIAVRTGRHRHALLFGALIAAAALTRAAALYYVLAVPLVFSIGRGLRSTAWLKTTALASLAFATLYLPWMAVNRHYFGEFIPTPTIGGGVMLYQTALRLTMPDEDERTAFLKREILPKYYKIVGGTHHDRLAGDRFMQREGTRIIRENLAGYPALLWQNFTRFWQFYPHSSEGKGSRTSTVYKLLGLGTYGIIFPFFLVGLLDLLRRRGTFRRLAAAYGFLAYFTLVHVVLYGKLRYRIPIDPLIIAFASAGIIMLLRRAAPALHQRLEGWVEGRRQPHGSAQDG